MNHNDYFYNCSKEYINSINPDLYEELVTVINNLPKRQTQTEINNDLFWLLTHKGWSYDTLSGVSASPPKELSLTNLTRTDTEQSNQRSLCITSTTLGASWHSDFARLFGDKLVQIEAQFGKVESMFKDFCGFRIARYERRIALGIEIVLCEPYDYFSHRRNAVGGMAYYGIAKNTVPAIGLDCPIWLIGIKE
jgi:hypothetical protein